MAVVAGAASAGQLSATGLLHLAEANVAWHACGAASPVAGAEGGFGAEPRKGEGAAAGCSRTLPGRGLLPCRVGA